MAKTLKKLTRQEALFIDEYFSNGFNAAAAYSEVYKTTNRKYAKFGGYRTLNKTHIKFQVDKLWDEIKSLNIVRREELLIHLKETLDKAVNDKDTQTILKTADIINKMTGNYITQIDANITSNITVSIPGLDLPEEETEEDEDESDDE